MNLIKSPLSAAPSGSEPLIPFLWTGRRTKRQYAGLATSQRAPLLHAVSAGYQGRRVIIFVRQTARLQIITQRFIFSVLITCQQRTQLCHCHHLPTMFYLHNQVYLEDLLASHSIRRTEEFLRLEILLLVAKEAKPSTTQKTIGDLILVS